MALSYASPTVPILGRTPISLQRLPNATDALRRFNLRKQLDIRRSRFVFRADLPIAITVFADFKVIMATTDSSAWLAAISVQLAWTSDRFFPHTMIPSLCKYVPLQLGLAVFSAQGHQLCALIGMSAKSSAGEIAVSRTVSGCGCSSSGLLLELTTRCSSNRGNFNSTCLLIKSHKRIKLSERCKYFK